MTTVPQFVPDFTPSMRQAAIDAIDNERFIMGESVHKFEEEFAHYIGTKRAVSVGSGTAALQLTLEALDLKGARAITAPTSFVATASAIAHAGLVPGFCDVQSDGNINPYKIPTSNLGAILPVHLHGRPSAMDLITELGESLDVPVIEDACQAHGSTFDGKMAGSLGTAGCFSFYTTKNMFVGGDGGIVTTNDDDLADRIEVLRNCGRRKNNPAFHDKLGFTSRLNTIQAAIGRAALRELPRWVTVRRALAESYDYFLRNEPLTLPKDTSRTKNSYHQYAVNTPRRDALRDWLETGGVSTGVHYPIPIHKQPALNQYVGDKTFPAAESFSRTTLSLPMFTSMTQEQIEHVCSSIRSFFEEVGA